MPTSLRSRIAAGALAIATLAATALTATAASASPTLAAPAPSPTSVYDSIPTPQPPSWSSVGFQARSTAEFGDLIKLGGSDRALTSVTVGLVDWACESDFTPSGSSWVPGPGGACTTTPGSSFVHPVTVTFYDVDNSGARPIIGKEIVSVTKDVTVPFRPSADPANCGTGDTRWFNPSTSTCHNGYGFTADFDIPGAHVAGDLVAVTVAYNTQTRGYDPIGVAGPYDSFNVALASVAPTVGTDETQGEVFQNSTHAGFYADGGAGGTGTLRADWSSTWAPFYGLVLDVKADNDLLVAPSTVVTVAQKDTKNAPETASTYLSWHEGRNDASHPVRHHVGPDGLTIGDGGASTFIKGTNVPSTEVTQSELRALLATASTTVEAGSVTFQVPLHFGNAWTDNFTTLRSTSQGVGTFKPALTQTWATTRNWGPYNDPDPGVQEEDTLEAFLTQLFAAYDHVWLGGYGVQAGSDGNSARISEFAWGDTVYEFFQPVIEPCTAIDEVEVSNLTDGDWDYSQTRTAGHHEFVAGGLRLYTDDATTLAKSAGYLDVDFPLADTGDVELNVTDNLGQPDPPAGSPQIPGMNLGIDLDGDGDREGYLVFEPKYYGGDLWASGDLDDHAVTGWPMNGGGGDYSGTLDEWLIAIPDAQVVEVGYSLGSGVLGDATLHSITANCVEYSFGYDTEATTTTITPSAASQVFGTASPATVGVVVKTASNGNGSGSVVLKDGSTTIGGPTVLSGTGTASFTLPASLTVGAHSLTAEFTPASGAAQDASTSSASTFTVGAVGTTTTALVNNPTQVLGTATPSTLAATVKTTSNDEGVGSVILKDGSTTVAGPNALNGSGTANLTVPASLAVGSHSLTVEFVPGSGSGQAGSTSSAIAFTVTAPGPDVTRLAGDDRYETAVEISSEYAAGVSRVYIATGTGYADALSAAPVAAKFDAPLLLVKPGEIPAVIKAELNRLKPAQIIIVGGEGAVSKKVQTQLAALAFPHTVKRIAGADRYETSRLVAKSGFPTADTVYLANGANFPDALSAGPAAAHFNGPVILVKGGSFQLERATRLLLEQLGADEVRIAGGAAVVSAGIKTQLEGLGYDVFRDAGTDRFSTAIAINAREFTSADKVYLATGAGFADALTGAALAGFDNAPLFLSAAGCIRADVKAAIMALDPDEVVLLGGTGVLSTNVENLATCAP